jgi:hypothetical protein
MFIIGFSLSMDVLIIAMMSLRNTFVYMQFHPLAYTVKLHIEMSMADLIGKIARDKHCGVIADGTFSSTITDGMYHLEQGFSEDSQTVLTFQQDLGNISKPRRMFRSYSIRAGEYERELPEP